MIYFTFSEAMVLIHIQERSCFHLRVSFKHQSQYFLLQDSLVWCLRKGAALLPLDRTLHDRLSASFQAAETIHGRSSQMFPGRAPVAFQFPDLPQIFSMLHFRPLLL